MLRNWLLAGMAGLGLVMAAAAPASLSVAAQPQAEVQAAALAPEPLTAEDMEILVARIALYPDELVALISAASLYPLQIVEADRFLTERKTNSALSPKPAWDGSVVSLLNYPEIVRMMSSDLDWTQSLGEAIVNQQEDVLAAIQQLRERAVAQNVITSNDKVTVVEEGDNIIIQPASKEVIYVPQYEPEMLYEPDYVYQPVTYAPDPYPYYYSPGAAFFAGAVTGAFWAAVIDWDDGFWGGDWDWNDGWGGDVDIDIDCDRCMIGNDFSGKLNIKDVDWTKIDRSKINFDRGQLKNIDRGKLQNTIKSNDRNRVTNKAAKAGGNRATALPSKGGKPVKDVRASTLEGLKKQPGPKPTARGDGVARPGDTLKGAGQGVSGQRPGTKPAAGKVDRPVGKKKPAAKADNRPRNPSPVGEIKRGVDAKKHSSRGSQAMGGGYKMPKAGGGGGGHSMKKRPLPSGGVSRGGGRGGGHGGGRGRR